MGCAYHPDRDSVSYCGHCKADLCESCVIRIEKRGSFCHRCLLALSLQEVKGETSRREQDEEDVRVGLQKAWRPTYIQAVVALGLVLVLVLVGLQLHWSQTEPRPRIILDLTQPVELLAGVQAALEEYYLAKGNRYPENLYDLVPEFLSDEGRNLRALSYLLYNRAVSEGYFLRIKPDSALSGEELIATALGIRPIVERE
jgi:hypothetical protein